MKNEIRHFIPGECATGPNKPTFVELDRGTQNAHLLALGQEACRSCLQLPDCERQRKPIAQELADRGVTGKTVIATEVIEVPAPQFDKDTPRRDTDFTFNLQHPLTEPRHILEIIRQGFRSRQLSIKVARAKQHKELSTDLEAILDAKKTELELSGAEITSWADTAAHLVLRYRHATDRDSRTTKLMQDNQAMAILTVFVEDALALRKARFKKPEILARTHNPEFYNRLARAYDTDADASVGLLHEILCDKDIDPLPERHLEKLIKSVGGKAQKKTSKIAKPALYSRRIAQKMPKIDRAARRQKLIERFSLEFKSRGVGISYLRDYFSEEKIRERLALYDEAVKVHSIRSERYAIHYYCFYKNTPDPIDEIGTWKRVVAKEAPLYKQLSIDVIKRLALTKRDEMLKNELNLRVKLQDELLEEYTHSPHPAIDPDVIRCVVSRYSPASFRRQLEVQKKCWEKVHAVPEIAETIANMDPAILRRLLTLNTKRPVEAIQAYKQLQDKYRDDDYIEPSMIDRAIRWGLRQAAVSTKNLRFLLAKTEAVRVSLYKERILKDGSSLPLHEKIADSTVSALDAHITSSQIDPEAPTREEATLLQLLDHLSPEECAAIATVYQIPWLLPPNMQNDGWIESDKVCAAFGVGDVDELEPIAETIINRLRDKK